MEDIKKDVDNYLKNLDTYSSVFDESLEFEYTENQLILFAAKYHKSKLIENQELKQMLSEISSQLKDRGGFDILTESIDNKIR